MKCNVGLGDRVVRIIIGVALVALGYFGVIPSPWSIVGYVVAGIAIVTGAVTLCPAYALFGLSTCNKETA